MVATAQMKMLFNNIRIRRDEKDILIKCEFGQKSRILKFLQNPNEGTYELPIIVINRGDLSIDRTRIANIHSNILKLADLTTNPDTQPPMNIKIGYDVSIITKYPNDMDMLLSNFIPFFNRDLFVRSPHPKLPGRTLDHQIMWSGEVNTLWPSELQNNVNDFQISNTSFTFFTELFGGFEKIKEDKTGEILYIDMTLSPATTNHPEAYSDNGDNVLAGFFPVPFAETFDAYADKILAMTNPEPDRDDLHKTL